MGCLSFKFLKFSKRTLLRKFACQAIFHKFSLLSKHSSFFSVWPKCIFFKQKEPKEQGLRDMVLPELFILSQRKHKYILSKVVGVLWGILNCFVIDEP